ncbi:hypothetical protein GCM10011316_02880 [Roseibium aquae]|uniref:Methyltransferase domain-containing protein n=1 Tax=Roseibium aquae TaxID=1323746 RepID=A0A916WVY4_9HYPH|nr:class I SAM-dependent methyltransferase [Roseibium aquae]GGB34200.1 hypothetical protein GCM10011316_02880 [Roseibium aquae]
MTKSEDPRFWDRISTKYAKFKISDPAGYERTLDRTRALLKPDDTVLELGCGTGSTALRLASAVKTYLATDFSPEMIRIAREKADAEPVEGLSFKVATAVTVDQDQGSFQAVLGFNYIHLVPDLAGALEHIHALLAPGGLFISKTPCLGDMNPLIRYALLPALQAIGKAPHLLSLRTNELEAAIATAGFAILASETHATNGKKGRPFIISQKGSA